jgi:peptidoglycan hydrolase FlgJ
MVNPISSLPFQPPATALKAPADALTVKPGAKPEELREAFGDFVGNTFYGQLIASMRKTVDKPAYFHGGRGEEVFQGQLDQMLAEKLSDSTKEQFAKPMFELFMLGRAG